MSTDSDNLLTSSECFHSTPHQLATTMMTVLVVYVFLYGKAYLALSGVGASLEKIALITNNKALQSVLDTQFLFQIGMFTAVPMLMGFLLEEGVLKYRATGRGFVVQHIKFADNYRFYSRSHFVKALEIVMLLLVHLAYGFDNSSISYIILSFSSWFLAISWLFAPSGFEWRKTVDDFNDWINWLLYKGGVGVKEEESWETWWEAEQVYGISWLVLVGIVLIFKVFSFSQKASVHFQMLVRFIQGMVSIMIFAGLVAIVLLKVLSVGDLFASLLAVIPTGWGILSIGIAWKYLVKKLGLWNFLRAIGWSYDAAMGMVFFFPIAVLSWFPFVSTFQTRLLFNQAFSRGLEISLILAGNRLNVHA